MANQESRWFEIRVLNDDGDVEYISRVKGQVTVDRRFGGRHYPNGVRYTITELEKLDASGSLEYVFDVKRMRDEDRRRFQVDKKIHPEDFQSTMVRVIHYTHRRVWRDSGTGKFVSPEYADANPDTTYGTTIRVPNYTWVPRTEWP